MTSKDVLALVQLAPPGIELCRISNMGKEVEDEATGEGGGEGGGTSGDRDSGATKDNSRGRSDGRPRMDKLCTLLLPPLRQERDGSGARSRARVVGHSASESTQDIRRSPAGRGRSTAVYPWDAAICFASRRRTVSSVSSCRSRGAREGCGPSTLSCVARHFARLCWCGSRGGSDCRRDRRCRFRGIK